MGARIGFELAAAYPARVAALVGSGGVDGPDDDPDEWRQAAAEIRSNGVRASLGSEPAPDWLIDHLCETDLEVFARGFEDLAGWTPWPLFPRIQAPTLIVAGEHEASQVPAAAAALPHGEYEILPGLGHLGAWLAVDRVVPQVRRFLEEALP